MIDTSITNSGIVHTADHALECLHIFCCISVQFYITDMTAIGQCMIRSFFSDLLVRGDWIPDRNMETICIILSVCHPRYLPITFLIHPEKSSGQAFCRCRKQRIIHLSFFCFRIRKCPHMTDNLKPLLLHLFTFPMMLSIQCRQSLCQTDVSNR